MTRRYILLHWVIHLWTTSGQDRDHCQVFRRKIDWMHCRKIQKIRKKYYRNRLIVFIQNIEVFSVQFRQREYAYDKLMVLTSESSTTSKLSLQEVNQYENPRGLIFWEFWAWRNPLLNYALLYSALLCSTLLYSALLY